MHYLTSGEDKKEAPVVEPKTPRQLLFMDYDKLRERCHQSIESFKEEGEVTETPDGIYIYKNNNAKVLAVAHLDVVASVRNNLNFKIDGDIIYATQFDDRLGVYIILDILPQFGIEVDVLLTENEEVGRSTAKHFKLPEGKEYNYMIEFDRMAKDPVMYMYKTKEYEDLLKKYGFSYVGHGTNTDIRYLSFLGIAGINFGVAYYNQHSNDCHMNTREFEEELFPKIKEFLETEKDTKTTYKPSQTTYTTNYQSSVYAEYDDDNWTKQINGKEKHKTRYVWIEREDGIQYLVCPECGKAPMYCPSTWYCQNKSTTDSACNICYKPTCIGFTICSICRMWYHNSLYVRTFSACFCCLLDAGVAEHVLDCVKSENKKIKDTAILLIDNFLNQPMDDTKLDVTIEGETDDSTANVL